MAESQATAPAPVLQPKPDYSKIKFQFLDDEPQLSSRFVQWLRTHHRKLTFLGAIIVFSTFVLKDGLQEQLKGLDDAIAGAESLYLLRKDADDLRFRLVDMATKLNLEQPTITFIEKTTDGNDYLNDEIGNNTMNMIRRLSDKVRNPDIAWRITAIEDKQQELSDDAYQLQALNGSDDDNNNPEYISKEQSRIDVQVFKLHRKMSLLSDALVKASKEAKEKAEENVHIATWASYFLYALGWGLGLVGRLVGVGAVGED